MGTILTHAWYVAPAFERDAISTDGITPDPDFDGDTLWLFDERDLAQLWGDRIEYVDNAEADIWRAALTGLNQEHHPHIVDAPNVEVRGHVPSAALEFMETRAHA